MIEPSPAVNSRRVGIMRFMLRSSPPARQP
jgi:hypothetical protein